MLFESTGKWDGVGIGRIRQVPEVLEGAITRGIGNPRRINFREITTMMVVWPSLHWVGTWRFFAVGTTECEGVIRLDEPMGLANIDRGDLMW